MSWQIRLNCPVCNNPLPVELYQEGGTRVAGGSCEADLNVTYNYHPHFDFKSLNACVAADTISDLEVALACLGDNPSEDYWEATTGNAGHAVAILLAWAKRYPSGVWEVA